MSFNYDGLACHHIEGLARPFLVIVGSKGMFPFQNRNDMFARCYYVFAELVSVACFCSLMREVLCYFMLCANFYFSCPSNWAVHHIITY